MKFRDFLLKRLLADTDYLVGYDADGHYIRISRADLATSIASSVTAPTLTVQYSANGDSWHGTYSAGDRYLRIKAGSGAWSEPITICVSAYDIWLELGHTGTKADFLESLHGEDGEGADFSSLRLQDLSDYDTLMFDVNAAIANAKRSIIEEVVNTAVTQVVSQYSDMQLSDISEVRSLSDDDYITIVTSDGLRKVKVSSLSDSVAVRTVSTSVLEKTVQSQLEILTITGAQNGENTGFTVSKYYVAGTSNLFLNGQRLVSGTDYREEAGGFTMMNAPISTDSLIFMAVGK